LEGADFTAEILFGQRPRITHAKTAMSNQNDTSSALGVVAGSKAALAQLFARARLSEHYWLEAIDLCETKKQRRSLAREIAELAKAAASNIASQPRR